MKRPYRAAFKRPWRGLSLPFMKKDTVIGTIGNTHGVSSIANPHRIASRIRAQRPPAAFPSEEGAVWVCGS